MGGSPSPVSSVPLEYLSGVRRSERRTALGLGEEPSGGGSGGPSMKSVFFRPESGPWRHCAHVGWSCYVFWEMETKTSTGIHRGRTRTGASRSIPERGGEGRGNGSLDTLEKALVRFGQSENKLGPKSLRFLLETFHVKNKMELRRCSKLETAHTVHNKSCPRRISPFSPFR